MLRWIDIEEPRESPQVLIAFTDGACLNNGKSGARGAYAVVWPEHPAMNEGLALPRNGVPHTNNRAELSAVLHAIRRADDAALDPDRKKTLILYTDSMLTIDSLTSWIHKWKRNGWIKASDGKRVANIDLLQDIDRLMGERKVVFRHVRAHTGKQDYESLHNARVDALARASVVT